MVVDKLVRHRLDHPGELHTRDRTLQRVRQRQHVHRVADGAQHDDDHSWVRDLQLGSHDAEPSGIRYRSTASSTFSSTSATLMSSMRPCLAPGRAGCCRSTGPRYGTPGPS